MNLAATFVVGGTVSAHVLTGTADFRFPSVFTESETASESFLKQARLSVILNEDLQSSHLWGGTKTVSLMLEASSICNFPTWSLSASSFCFSAVGTSRTAKFGLNHRFAKSHYP
jgi:hypothetical protein